MTRAAYGKDTIYSRMARDSLAEWKSLSQRSDANIFHPLGVLFFTTTPDDFFAESLRASRDLGLPIEEMGRKALQARFPMINFDDVELGLHEPRFGALMARRAVQTLVAEFVAAGGEYRQLEAQILEGQGPMNAIRLSDGSLLEADAFVFAAGPWLGKLFSKLLGGRIVPTRQEIFYFSPPPGDSRFSSFQMPGWAEFSAGDFHYGFPDLEGAGVKFARHCDGPVIDPDTQSRKPSAAALDEIIAYRDHRFPDLRGSAVIHAEVCQYENSSNGDFLIDFHPEIPNLLIVGGGSGHGFKHGPEVGRYAAGRLAGTVEAEARFSLASKKAGQRREIH